MKKFLYILLFAVILMDLPIVAAIVTKQVYQYRKNTCIEQCVKASNDKTIDCEYSCKYEM